MQSEKLTKFDKRLIEKVRHTINRTIEEQNLICEGDHVLVGVSGGKDSLILLETLATRRRYVKEKYSITAVHVKVKNISYKIDKTWLSNFCKKLNVDFIYREIEYEQDEKHKSPCYFCSWSRRKEFFTLSKELGCNKIATGHHLDDAIETLFLNMIYHAKICSMPATFTMFDERLDFIRPMIEVMEDQLVEYANISQFPKLKNECPHDSITKRKEVRNIIEQISQLHSQAKINIFNSMSDIRQEYLPISKKVI